MLDLKDIRLFAAALHTQGVESIEFRDGNRNVLIRVVERFGGLPMLGVPAPQVNRAAEAFEADAPVKGASETFSASPRVEAAIAALDSKSESAPTGSVSGDTKAPSVSDVQELGRKVITAKGRPAFDEVMKATGKMKVAELDEIERAGVYDTLTAILNAGA